jgi:hypothetical protein
VNGDLKRGTPNPLTLCRRTKTWPTAWPPLYASSSPQTRRALVACRGPQFYLSPIAVGTRKRLPDAVLVVSYHVGGNRGNLAARQSYALHCIA